jgi:hypothetical protein
MHNIFQDLEQYYSELSTRIDLLNDKVQRTISNVPMIFENMNSKLKQHDDRLDALEAHGAPVIGMKDGYVWTAQPHGSCANKPLVDDKNVEHTSLPGVLLQELFLLRRKLVEFDVQTINMHGGYCIMRNSPDLKNYYYGSGEWAKEKHFSLRFSSLEDANLYMSVHLFSEGTAVPVERPE